MILPGCGKRITVGPECSKADYAAKKPGCVKVQLPEPDSYLTQPCDRPGRKVGGDPKNDWRRTDAALGRCANKNAAWNSFYKKVRAGR